MIFVTVGSDLPFDRLVKAVDEWAIANNRSDVFAQIGETEWKPIHIRYKHFLDPKDFHDRMSSATAIISHAGMGTILTALRTEKPILVMPRLRELREVRNNHQTATSIRLREMGKIDVAMDTAELKVMLDRLGELRPKTRIEAHAGPELISALREFIFRH